MDNSFLVIIFWLLLAKIGKSGIIKVMNLAKKNYQAWLVNEGDYPKKDSFRYGLA